MMFWLVFYVVAIVALVAADEDMCHYSNDDMHGCNIWSKCLLETYCVPDPSQFGISVAFMGGVMLDYVSSATAYQASFMAFSSTRFEEISLAVFAFRSDQSELVRAAVHNVSVEVQLSAKKLSAQASGRWPVNMYRDLDQEVGVFVAQTQASKQPSFRPGNVSVAGVALDDYWYYIMSLCAVNDGWSVDEASACGNAWTQMVHGFAAKFASL